MAVLEVQDLGRERVEERVTGFEGIEDEVEAMNEEFSLRLKTKDQNRIKTQIIPFWEWKARFRKPNFKDEYGSAP